MTFSYGRALQDDALRTWHGSADNVAEAQKVFTHRAALTGAAREGTYEPDMETGDLSLRRGDVVAGLKLHRDSDRTGATASAGARSRGPAPGWRGQVPAAMSGDHHLDGGPLLG